MIQALILISLATVQAAPPATSWTTSLSAAQVQSIIVNLDDGAKISGSVTVKATVRTSDIVLKVELYRDDQLIGSQSSTPYEFKIDTTALPDGPLNLKLIAYTDTGGKITKKLTLKVDNGLSAGVGPHIAKASKLLSNSDYDGAIAEGNTALRIDSSNLPARLILARAYYGKGVYDHAQSYCDEILSKDPNNADALNLASAVGVQEAFAVIAKQDQADQSLDNMKQAFDYAIDNRTKYLNLQLGKLDISKTDPYTYAAEASKAHKYSLAIQPLSAILTKNTSDTKAANWLAYSQFMAGRFSDATSTLTTLKRAFGGKYDAYTKAIQALLAAHYNDMATADKVLSDAILDDMSNLGVRTSQASIALSENNAQAQANLVQSLASDAGQYPEVNYLVSAAANQVGDYDLARSALKQGLLADAANYSLYVEAGNQAMRPAMASKEDPKLATQQYQIAQMFYKEALRAKGDSSEALTGLAITDMLLKNPGQAVADATAATKAAPDYAAGHYALAMALATASSAQSLTSKQSDDMMDQASAEMKAAGKADPSRLGDAAIPSAAICWKYFISGGRILVIAHPSLTSGSSDDSEAGS